MSYSIAIKACLQHATFSHELILLFNPLIWNDMLWMLSKLELKPAEASQRSALCLHCFIR